MQLPEERPDNVAFAILEDDCQLLIAAACIGLHALGFQEFHNAQPMCIERLQEPDAIPNLLHIIKDMADAGSELYLHYMSKDVVAEAEALLDDSQ